MHIGQHPNRTAKFGPATSATGPSVLKMRHRRAMTGRMLGIVTINDHDPAVESRDPLHKIHGHASVVAKNGKGERTFALFGEHDGVVCVTVRHKRANRAEGFDRVDRFCRIRVFATQKGRFEKSAFGKIAMQFWNFSSKNDLSLRRQLPQVGDHIRSLGNSGKRAQSGRLIARVTDRRVAKA